VTDRPIGLHRGGPPETVLPAAVTDVTASLDTAIAEPDTDRRRALIKATVAKAPRYLDGWAHLGELAEDPVEAYAYFRVGYHRGLDQLRQAGWKGSGYVRWEHETNRGFLRSLNGLRKAAAAIGETDEEDRCAEFLVQLDPSGPWRDER
jgi:Protein of unknown function (DUF3151)